MTKVKDGILKKYGSPEHNYDDSHTLKLYDDMKFLGEKQRGLTGGERENSKRSGVCEGTWSMCLYIC